MSGISEDFPCNNCGSKLHYDAESQTMKCIHCKSKKTIYHFDIPIEEGIKIASRGFGTPVDQFDCSECGAVVNVAKNNTTAKCVFCGSQKVLAKESSGNPITPKAIVPFEIDQKQANAKFSKWLNKLWFRPNDLKKSAKIEGMNGVYIPFWVFDALVKSNWNAESGFRYTETEWVRDFEGRTALKEIEKVRWESSYGNRHDYFSGNLICASRLLNKSGLTSQLKTFNVSELIPYRAEFLAGWQAESYVIDLLPAWVEAQKNMEATQKIRCANDVPGDEYRFLSVKNKFSNVSFKHVLLPIWISTYRYKNKPYQFLVNGQTGEAVGSAPWSIPKIAAAITALLGGVVALAWLGSQNRV